MRKFISYLLVVSFLFACNPATKDEKKEPGKKLAPNLDVKVYGVIGNDTVHQYTMTNSNGMVIKFLDYGLTVTNIIVPDKNGKFGDVVLGFDSLNGYLQKGNPYFGCVVGRYANRIANAKFSLDGKTYQLNANDHGNSLHGGVKGFDKVIWVEAKRLVDSSEGTLVSMKYLSHDGEEGYPGNLKITVTYSLTNQNEFWIGYQAESDKPTPVNLTNHCYFNLSGGDDSTVLDHQLMIRADQFTEVDENLIPTGKLPSVINTPMNFNLPKKIGSDIGKIKGGFDHNWVLSKNKNKDSAFEMETVATLYHPFSGRYLEVSTSEPGLQFYSGNFLDGTLIGKNGRKYVQHAGLCLETQHFPDSPNQPSFPNTILQPGDVYQQTTIYKFSTH